jgi:hypothetical protein
MSEIRPMSLTSSWHEFYNWAAGLPPVVHGAAIGVTGALLAASLALVGVRMTLTSNRKKHVEDREFAMRKNVYLEFVEAAQTMKNYAAGFFDRELTVAEGMQSILALGGAAAKIHATAGRETVAAVFHLQSVFQDVWVRTVKKKMEILSATEKLEELDGHYPGARLGEILSKSTQAQVEYEKIMNECIDASLQNLADLRNPMMEVVIAARKEFHLPLDEKWYRAESDKLWEGHRGKLFFNFDSRLEERRRSKRSPESASSQL